MIVDVEKDDDGNLILPLTDEVCEELGWTVGDILQWKDNGDGSWSLSKMHKKLVMVECISMFRTRYVVEVPDGKTEWALDTVAMNEAKEFSQLHIGEQIVSHRVIDEAEYLQKFDEDNDYLKTLNNEAKLQFIKRFEEQNKANIEHSSHYYDMDRNK